MKLIEMLMGLFGGKGNKMGDIGKLKDQAADLMEQHGEKLDQVTDKIPGQKDDELVDQAREVLKK